MIGALRFSLETALGFTCRGAPQTGPPAKGMGHTSAPLSGASRCSAACYARPRSCSTVRPMSLAICRSRVGEISRPA